MKSDTSDLLNDIAVNQQESNHRLKRSKKFKWKNILIGGFGILFFVGLCISSILILQKYSQNPLKTVDSLNIQNEIFLSKNLESGLIASLKKEMNQMAVYHNEKNITVHIDIKDDPQERNETIITDFVLNIFGKTKDSRGEEVTKARIVVLNMTRNDGLDNIYLSGLNVLDAKTVKEISELEAEDLEKMKINKTGGIDSKTGRFIDTLPIFEFGFFKNGSLYDYSFPTDVHGFVESHVEDIILKIVPVIAEHSYQKKTKETKLKLGTDPGYQKLYEQNGKFTTLYQHECIGIETPEINFEGSRMNSDTKIKINNALGYVENIFSKGEALFVKEEEDLSTVSNESEGEYESLEDLKNSKDNIVENDINSIGSDFTSSIDLIYLENNKTISELLTLIMDKSIVDYYNLENIPEKKETLFKPGRNLKAKILTAFGASLTPNKKDMSKVPMIKTKTQLRKLKEQSIEKPIEFQYSIFKFNLVGVKISLNALVRADPNKG
ncbi:MAG: hypothetical protein MJ252_10280, partial [archaeon]|nr:hypothetical protein [archaeon]